MPGISRARDDLGWRIPRRNTLSRDIYNLAKAGKTPIKIASALGIFPSTVRVLLFRIRNPKKANLYNAAYYKNRRERDRGARAL